MGYRSDVLNSIRNNQTLRISLIVAMLLGWVVLSQRCVLGQMLKAAQTAAVQHECCKRGSQPPVNAPTDRSPRAECCQALKVLLPDAAKLPLAAPTEGVWLSFEWMLTLLPPLTTERALLSDTGPPPDQPGFVELVLHRSLRSHAPPVPA